MYSMSGFSVSISRCVTVILPRPSLIASDLSNATSRSTLARSCLGTKVAPYRRLLSI